MDEADPHNAPDLPVLRLGEYLPYRLAIASNQVSSMVARAYQSRFGITIWEWRVIAILGEGRAMTAQGLCDVTAMDKVSVSRAVRSLADRGVIERSSNRADRRSHLLALTPAGRAIYAEIAPVALQAEAALVTGLSPDEVALLSTLLDRLRDRARDLRDG
ncbi:MarR family winged helix-turn-helix transcriptional regulator [Maricaulis sp.]|uniref:MarR family winged helix-turn-helix transcriptional regulator n=1 Tax=Maricaulis sp. TaxID=1486257 RepID=UPI003A93DD49|tara:strand:- start:1547 stop:2026 length:480 start_codon:yes stop_codon:yes gene_type:complete